VQWQIAKRRKSIEKLVNEWQKSLAQAYEKLKAQVRTRVEHPFHVVKNIFKHKGTVHSRLLDQANMIAFKNHIDKNVVLRRYYMC
jgi:IS5 family transposase